MDKSAGHRPAPDGKVIWYDLQTPNRRCSGSPATLATRRNEYKGETRSLSVHFNVSPATLFAGDGGGPNSGENSQWINLFTPKDGAAGGGSSWTAPVKHDYRLEPNVTFTVGQGVARLPFQLARADPRLFRRGQEVERFQVGGNGLVVIFHQN